VTARPVKVDVVNERIVSCPFCHCSNHIYERGVGGVYRCGACHAALPNPFTRQPKAIHTVKRAWRKFSHFIVGLAVTCLFIGGGGLVFVGINAASPKRIFAGAALLVAVWFAARAQGGAWSLNGFGTSYYGQIDSPQGSIHTKWLSVFFVPTVPVRSYYLFEISDVETTHDEHKATYKQARLPGFGLYWPSVEKSLVWTFVGVFALILIYALFGFLPGIGGP
jgi:hypothetical protein